MKHHKLNSYLLSLTIALSLCMNVVQAKKIYTCSLVKFTPDGTGFSYVDGRGKDIEKPLNMLQWEDHGGKNINILHPGNYNSNQLFSQRFNGGELTDIQYIDFTHNYCLIVTVKHNLADQWYVHRTKPGDNFWQLTRTLDPYFNSIFSKVRKTDTRDLLCTVTAEAEQPVAPAPSCKRLVPDDETKEEKTNPDLNL
jgi:hypothetical protein